MQILQLAANGLQKLQNLLQNAKILQLAADGFFCILQILLQILHLGARSCCFNIGPPFGNDAPAASEWNAHVGPTIRDGINTEILR